MADRLRARRALSVYFWDLYTVVPEMTEARTKPVNANHRHLTDSLDAFDIEGKCRWIQGSGVMS